jgi:hypothetical protein
MRTYFNAALAGCATILSLAGVALGDDKDDCTQGPTDGPLKYWGKTGSGQQGFCHTQWTHGLVVVGIEVWATQWQIKGIKLTYSDGTSPPMEGDPSGDQNRHDSISWNPQDQVTAFKLAGNYAGDGLGLVHIEVAGKTLDVRSDTGSFNGDTVDVGSGILLGAKGEAGPPGDFVRAWAPVFLGKSSGPASILDVVYDDDLNDLTNRQA